MKHLPSELPALFVPSKYCSAPLQTAFDASSAALRRASFFLASSSFNCLNLLKTRGDQICHRIQRTHKGSNSHYTSSSADMIHLPQPNKVRPNQKEPRICVKYYAPSTTCILGRSVSSGGSGSGRGGSWRWEGSPLGLTGANDTSPILVHYWLSSAQLPQVYLLSRAQNVVGQPAQRRALAIKLDPCCCMSLM
jgi:hypothetical protein